MTPTNEGVEFPPPLAIAQEEVQTTEDYCRDGMAFFEVSSLFGICVLSVADLAHRLKMFFSVFPNVSSSPVRESSDHYSSTRRKRMSSPCLT